MDQIVSIFPCLSHICLNARNIRAKSGKKRDKTGRNNARRRRHAIKRVSTFEMMRRIQIGPDHGYINSPCQTGIFLITYNDIHIVNNNNTEEKTLIKQ